MNVEHDEGPQNFTKEQYQFLLRKMRQDLIEGVWREFQISNTPQDCVRYVRLGWSLFDGLVIPEREKKNEHSRSIKKVQISH